MLLYQKNVNFSCGDDCVFCDTKEQFVLFDFTICFELYSPRPCCLFAIFKIGKYGDFSYGVYIYAFPVQQLLSFFKFNQYGFTTYVMLSMLLTSFLSILSWFLIEKPSLAIKNFSLLNTISSKNLWEGEMCEENYYKWYQLEPGKAA